MNNIIIIVINNNNNNYNNNNAFIFMAHLPLVTVHNHKTQHIPEHIAN